MGFYSALSTEYRIILARKPLSKPTITHLKKAWMHYKAEKQHIHTRHYHYSDVIMGAMAFRITSLTIIYSTVYSGADQRKHKRSASLAFVRGIRRWTPHTKGQ